MEPVEKFNFLKFFFFYGAEAGPFFKNLKKFFDIIKIVPYLLCGGPRGFSGGVNIKIKREKKIFRCERD